jgi:hypothetical protein
METNVSMITLEDVNAITGSFDGNIYSDLFKDVYGTRPRGVVFSSIEDFYNSLHSLSDEMDREITREREMKAAAARRFEDRIVETMQLVNGADRRRAIEIIAEAEGICGVCEKNLEVYGIEALEYELGLEFGYIEKSMDN